MPGSAYANAMATVYPPSTPELRIKMEQTDPDAQDVLQSLGNIDTVVVVSEEVSSTCNYCIIIRTALIIY